MIRSPATLRAPIFPLSGYSTMSGATMVEIIRTRMGESVRFADLVVPVLPSPEDDDITLLKILFAVGGAQRRLPPDDDEPLLVCMVRVVRPEPVPGLELVHAAADQLGVQPSPDPRVLGAPALALLGAVPLIAVEIEDVHA